VDPILAGVDTRLTTDFQFFAERAPLVIKDDQGHFIPFHLNTAQKYAHAKMEEQRRTKGWVRALVIKGRQQGMSTYINARYFHRIVRSRGLSVFILSHESKTTDKLFTMVRRYYENMHPVLRPQLGKDNPHEMTFPGLGADYSAATARNEDAGRGGTAQLFHGSEAAFWPNAYAIQESALESIRLAEGTEIILESTGNGPTGMFAEKCRAAIKGIGDYILVFIPWYWELDYERDDDGSELTEEEDLLVRQMQAKPFPFASSAITLAQARRKIMWRRGKVVEFSPMNKEVGSAKFRAVYPSDPNEAFMATAIGEISASAIKRAQLSDNLIPLDSFAARIGACDPAGKGKKSDRTVFAVRQGKVLEKVLRFQGLTHPERVEVAAKIIRDEKLDMLFYDNGYGEADVESLHSLGYKRKVIGVWFNQRPENPDKYVNKRSEMLLSLAEWVNAGGVSIPNGGEEKLTEDSWVCGGDEIAADLASLPMHRLTANNLKQMAPKEEIIKALGCSTDIADACGLTFAFEVRGPAQDERGNNWRKPDSSDTMGGVKPSRSGLRSLARKRALG
jgi:hypothetical protein